jgi:hypothetical protein
VAGAIRNRQDRITDIHKTALTRRWLLKWPRPFSLHAHQHLLAQPSGAWFAMRRPGQRCPPSRLRRRLRHPGARSGGRAPDGWLRISPPPGPAGVTSSLGRAFRAARVHPGRHISPKPRRRRRGQGSRSDERSELALDAASTSVAPDQLLGTPACGTGGGEDPFRRTPLVLIFHQTQTDSPGHIRAHDDSGPSAGSEVDDEAKDEKRPIVRA